MWLHLWHLLSAAWVQVLAWHSATPYSLASQIIIVPIAIFCFTWRVQFGKDWKNWPLIKDQASTVVKIGGFSIGLPVVLVALAFCFAIPVVVYVDHEGLVGSRKQLVDEKSKLVDPKSLDAKMLAQSVRIATCEKNLEIVKHPVFPHGTPAPSAGSSVLQFFTKLLFVVSGSIQHGNDFYTPAEVLVHPNQKVSPVNVLLRCDGAFKVQRVDIPGSGLYIDRHQNQVDERTFSVEFSVPAWEADDTMAIWILAKVDGKAPTPTLRNCSMAEATP